MVKVIFEQPFEKKFKKITNSRIKEQIIKQIYKIKENPTIGKPMRYSRKKTRELYISPYRLSYLYQDDTIHLLDLYHKDKQ